MSRCCGDKDSRNVKARAPCNTPQPECCAGTGDRAESSTFSWFGEMLPHCHDYAKAHKEKGGGIVGIMCEYTPRELIMAAGALPVCLCGGSAATIPAAEEYLPANLCPLIKSTFGYNLTKTNPFLEMADLIVAETTCDGKKKMFELLSDQHEMHVLELPQKPEDPDALAHWVAELRKLKNALELRFEVTITDEKLRDAILLMNTERDLRRRLAELMKADSPPLTGLELINLKSIISCMPEDFEQYRLALDTLSQRHTGSEATSRVRVLLTGVPLPHGAERVLEIIEKSDGLVVCQENCTGLKPILEDVDSDADDLIVALARKYFHLPCSVMTKNDGRKESLRKLATEYRPDCVIEVIWQACITYDVESAIIKRFAEEDLGVPYLRIETDYSPSDSARIALRVQALFETVRGQSG